ncbi:cytidine deaminase [Enterococcus faecalis]|uniref:cytidine deaminase family protein n=1 Tax=Enterococcus faecalis TaxID=1351 RepID=UPI001920ED7F|nr:cytidine deaminase [Enterococcus faecalis]MDV5011267.1 cytidine deaminase [Enterococcus faecium]UYY44520.1 cytidine deaminase [Enterococcus faecalis]HCR3189319.1 cytidine deaminase [Enterococcus faecalis]
MDKEELYRIAYNGISHKNLRQFGVAGHVCCALETVNGSVFTGLCIDLPCSIGICAEQAAIAEMVKNNETVIEKIVAVYEDGSILPPCGRCREFISQINDKNMNTRIILPGLKEVLLQELLPERWDYKWK